MTSDVLNTGVLIKISIESPISRNCYWWTMVVWPAHKISLNYYQLFCRGIIDGIRSSYCEYGTYHISIADDHLTLGNALLTQKVSLGYHLLLTDAADKLCFLFWQHCLNVYRKTLRKFHVIFYLLERVMINGRCIYTYIYIYIGISTRWYNL